MGVAGECSWLLGPAFQLRCGVCCGGGGKQGVEVKLVHALVKQASLDIMEDVRGCVHTARDTHRGEFWWRVQTV